MVFQIIAWCTMCAMMIVSNSYLETSTGKLAEVTSINQIEKLDACYLKIESILLNRQFGSAHTEFRVSGKYHQRLNFNTYFVHPFATNTPEGKFKYWYGVRFKKQISNTIEPEEKEREYRKFFERSAKEFELYNFSEPSYFEILGHSYHRDGFINAVQRREKLADSNPVIIEPREGLYFERNKKKFEWIFGSFGIGFGIFLFFLRFAKYQRSEHKRQRKGIKPKSDELPDMLKFLIPKDEHCITSIIINLNIVVFVCMVISGVHFGSPNSMELLEWGANRRAETSHGDWWRLVSSMFLHGGIMHLFLNIFGLVIAAIFVEPVYSRVKYLIIYLASGICGSLASIYWYENAVSVGASGAIFGLYGAILGLTLTNAFPKNDKKDILMFIGPYVGISLLFGLTEGIDNAAHIGGLLSGVVLGIALYLTDKKRQANTVHSK